MVGKESLRLWISNRRRMKQCSYEGEEESADCFLANFVLVTTTSIPVNVEVKGDCNSVVEFAGGSNTGIILSRSCDKVETLIFPPKFQLYKDYANPPMIEGATVMT